MQQSSGDRARRNRQTGDSSQHPLVENASCGSSSSDGGGGGGGSIAVNGHPVTAVARGVVNGGTGAVPSARTAVTRVPSCSGVSALAGRGGEGVLEGVARGEAVRAGLAAAAAAASSSTASTCCDGGVAVPGSAGCVSDGISCGVAFREGAAGGGGTAGAASLTYATFPIRSLKGAARADAAGGAAGANGGGGDRAAVPVLSGAARENEGGETVKGVVEGAGISEQQPYVTTLAACHSPVAPAVAAAAAAAAATPAYGFEHGQHQSSDVPPQQAYQQQQQLAYQQQQQLMYQQQQQQIYQQQQQQQTYQQQQQQHAQLRLRQTAPVAPEAPSGSAVAAATAAEDCLTESPATTPSCGVDVGRATPSSGFSTFIEAGSENGGSGDGGGTEPDSGSELYEMASFTPLSEERLAIVKDELRLISDRAKESLEEVYPYNVLYCAVLYLLYCVEALRA